MQGDKGAYNRVWGRGLSRNSSTAEYTQVSRISFSKGIPEGEGLAQRRHCGQHCLRIGGSLSLPSTHLYTERLHFTDGQRWLLTFNMSKLGIS